MLASEKAQNKLRIKVQQELKEIMFDNNDYICRIKRQQYANRSLREQSWDKRKRFIAAKKRTERKDAYRRTCKIRNDIDDLFNDAQRTPRYR